MIYIEQFVYSNKLRNTHPIERVLFALVTMALALLIKSWQVHLLIIFSMYFLLVFKAKIKSRVVIKLLMLPLGFLLIGVLTIAIQISAQNLPYLFSISLFNYNFGITENSLQIAFNTMTVSLSAVSCLYFMALTTPMVELLYVFQLFKLPNVIIELMSLIYRLIFVFIDTAFNIYYAQQARYGHSSFKKSITSFALLFANLWGKAFFKSKNLLHSLESRGFEGNLKVLSPKYTFSKRNITLFVFVDLIIIFSAFIIR